MTPASWCLLAVMAHALAAAGQEEHPDIPPLTFRSQVNYIEVDVRVTDPEGRFVADLTADDFEVREEGKPQDIVFFSLVNVAAEPAAAPGAESDVSSDVATNRRAPPRRLYLLVLDDLHTAPLRTPFLKKAASAFIEEHLTSADLAGVVFTSGYSGGNQGFTSNRESLRATVERFLGKKSPTPPADPDVDPFRIGVGPDPREGTAKTVYRTLAAAAEALAPVQGRRKAVLWFGEGVAFDIENPQRGGADGAVVREMLKAIGAANRANVAIYGIDPRGLVFQEELLALDGVRRAHGSLWSLSRETGGFALYNQNDLAPGFSRLVEENSRYYLLGYYAPPSEDDGFRELQVDVRRRGVEVRARKGYVPTTAARGIAAPTSDVARPLMEVLASPVPLSEIPLRAVAVPLRAGGDEIDVLVAVEVGVEGLEGEIDAGALAFDTRKGKVATGSGRSIETRRDRGDALRLTFELPLSPGSFRIAVAVRERVGDRAGSVFYDVEIPEARDFFGSLLVTTERESRLPAVQGKTQLPFFPTTRRELEARDVLLVAADLHRTRNAPPRSDLEIATVLRSADGAALYEKSKTIARESLPREGGAFPHRSAIPLDNFPPGRYLLEWTARELRERNGLYRAVPFWISARPDACSCRTAPGDGKVGALPLER